ncbi:cation transporter, partial [bacterium]|nr:cation transporter [bacterium]
MDGSNSLSDAHKIATDIENRVFEKFGITATIHIEPTDFNHKLD